MEPISLQIQQINNTYTETHHLNFPPPRGLLYPQQRYAHRNPRGLHHHRQQHARRHRCGLHHHRLVMELSTSHGRKSPTTRDGSLARTTSVLTGQIKMVGRDDVYTHHKWDGLHSSECSPDSSIPVFMRSPPRQCQYHEGLWHGVVGLGLFAMGGTAIKEWTCGMGWRG